MATTKQGMVNMVNMLRAENPNYAARLNRATVDNVLELGGQIAGNPAMFNDFMQIINKVAETYVTSPSFQNKLAKNKREVSEFGGLLEEIFIGLVDPAGFREIDSAIDLFKAERPNISSAYYGINREERYKVTVDNVEIKQGITKEDMFTGIVDRILETLTTSNSRDEYRYMKMLIDGAYAKGELFLIAVGDIEAPGEAGEQARRRFLEKAREYSVHVEYENTFNAKGLINMTPLEKMTHYTTAKTTSKIDVNELAQAFNMGKADFIGAQEVLNAYEDPNLLATFVENSFFVVADNLRETTSQFDAAQLKTNYFLIVRQYIARSPFATAIGFVKEIPADRQGRLLLDPPVGVLGYRTGTGEQKDSIVVNTSIELFDGATADVSDAVITAVADTTGVDVSVLGDVVTITANGSAEPGELFNVTFKATYDTDKEITAKGVYTVSKFYK